MWMSKDNSVNELNKMNIKHLIGVRGLLKRAIQRIEDDESMALNFIINTPIIDIGPIKAKLREVEREINKREFKDADVSKINNNKVIKMIKKNSKKK